MQSRMASAVLIAACAGCELPITPPDTDAWVGRWNGPEGTYLEIASIGSGYEVTIKDLDAARTFIGSAADGRIEFRRDGVPEAIKATNGDETGMTWLAGKTNCLTIKLGEGYCRD